MKRVLIYYTFIILAWIAAWLFYEQMNLELQSSLVEFVYWTIAKLIIWIFPFVLIIKLINKQSVTEYLAFHNWKRGVGIGIIVGLIFIGLSFLLDVFIRGFGVPQLTIGFFSAVFVAPLLEEAVFRGYMLGSLEKSGYGFWFSNFLVAMAFLGIHLPGWYFMESANLTQPILILSIILIGNIAGYAKKRSGSTWSSVAFHFTNNLYSAFIK